MVDVNLEVQDETCSTMETICRSIRNLDLVCVPNEVSRASAEQAHKHLGRVGVMSPDTLMSL